MAGDKYIYENSGTLTEKAANTSSAGAGDAGKIVALDGSGRIDASMMPVGIAADTSSIVASEALAAGDLVNVWDDAGTGKVRKADASTSGKEAHGFVLASVLLGGTATVYWEGTNTGLAGMTPGVLYLSDTVAGSVTSTAPSGTGKTVQRVGFAASATAMNFQSGVPVVLA